MCVLKRRDGAVDRNRKRSPSIASASIYSFHSSPERARAHRTLAHLKQFSRNATEKYSFVSGAHINVLHLLHFKASNDAKWEIEWRAGKQTSRYMEWRMEEVWLVSVCAELPIRALSLSRSFSSNFLLVYLLILCAFNTQIETILLASIKRTHYTNSISIADRTAIDCTAVDALRYQVPEISVLEWFRFIYNGFCGAFNQFH